MDISLNIRKRSFSGQYDVNKCVICQENKKYSFIPTFLLSYGPLMNSADYGLFSNVVLWVVILSAIL
jgi:hypothetical protein